MTELAALVTAFSLIIVPTGSALFMFFLRLNKRVTDLETDKITIMSDMNLFAMCVKLLAAEVGRLDPKSGNPVLEQVSVMMGRQFPVDPDTPADMIALLDAIDAKMHGKAGRKKQ